MIRLITLVCLLVPLVTGGKYRKAQPPVGPQLYNFLGLGGYDPFGLIKAPLHRYSGPYYDEGPVRRVNDDTNYAYLGLHPVHRRRKRDAPSSEYGAPAPSYGPPVQSYGPPAPSYGPPAQTYGPPGGGGKGDGKGDDDGGIFSGLRKTFKGIRDSFSNYVDDYFSSNSNSKDSYEEEGGSYYAPDYVPIYYQTYDYNSGSGEKDEGGGFMHGLRKRISGFGDSVRNYGDNAIKGIRDFGERTRNRIDDFNKRATKRIRGIFSPDSEEVDYVPVPSYGAPAPTYGAPAQSYGPPVQSYGPPPSAYGAPGGGHHGGGHHGGGHHGGFGRSNDHESLEGHGGGFGGGSSYASI